MRAAAKAMVKLFGGAHGKAWGFFVVEWTAGRIIGAGFFKRHAFVHDVNNVNAIEKLLNETFWYQNALRQRLNLKDVASVFYRMFWKQKRSD
jgi:lipoprotein NlpI